MDRTFADPHGSSVPRDVLLKETELRWRRQHGLALIDDGFEQLDRGFLGGAADVSSADIVVVGEDPGGSAIEVDALDPVRFDLSAFVLANLQRCEFSALVAGELLWTAMAAPC